jgi:AcrR family transcriptional regulator
VSSNGADAEGLAAASMGRLAGTLGVGTMTLYTYVKSRAELVDLMVDQTLRMRALPGPGEARPAGWRAQVELFGERTRSVYRAHPWLAQASRMRPPIGPGTIAESEYVLSTVRQVGLPLEAEESYRYGLSLLLDGLAAQVSADGPAAG